MILLPNSEGPDQKADLGLRCAHMPEEPFSLLHGPNRIGDIYAYFLSFYCLLIFSFFFSTETI